MADPGLSMFESLASLEAVEALIEAGEAEGLYLECKSPREPRLDRGLKSQLAEAVSGFGNSGGGVILWGVATARHPQENLDVLTDIVPVGMCRRLAQQIDIAIPTLTNPSVIAPPSRVLLQSPAHGQGLVVTYLPPTSGDPVQVNQTRKFHIRIGDGFPEMPYETLKRMFLGSQAPDLHLLPVNEEITTDGEWKLEITLSNESSAIARDATITMSVSGDKVDGARSAPAFKDASDLNPGKRVFITGEVTPIHRGINRVMGDLWVSPRRNVRSLTVRVEVYADRMRARGWDIQLRRRGRGEITATIPAYEFLY